MAYQNLLIIGCSRKKVETSNSPVRAIDLYMGGVFPDLKKHFNLKDDFLDSVFILSGKFGLISSKDLLYTYDYKLEYKKSWHLVDEVYGKLNKIILDRDVKNILIISEPEYFVLASKLFCDNEKPNIFWEPNMDYLSEWAQEKIANLFPEIII